jgi:hypothetical protein
MGTFDEWVKDKKHEEEDNFINILLFSVNGCDVDEEEENDNTDNINKDKAKLNFY